ncbi:MAG TPA: SLATT domain-containing protein [Phototrophicaceae bacterium]|nr:SLATT domain-containing protein [Phototrophicaceae bacterium]
MSLNQTPPALNPLDTLPHSPEDMNLLFQLYLDKRIEVQLDFYQNRGRENQLNSDFTFTIGTLIMTLSALLATIGATAAIPIFALISAILPAFSALLAAFRQLYGWDRQSALYRDAALGLEKIRLLVPDDDRLAYSDISPLFPKLVISSETVFTAEVSQWGQVVMASEEDEKEAQSSDPLARLMASANLSSDQIAAIENIVSSSGSSGVGLRAVTTDIQAAAQEYGRRSATEVKVQTTTPEGQTQSTVIRSANEAYTATAPTDAPPANSGEIAANSPAPDVSVDETPPTEPPTSAG